MFDKQPTALVPPPQKNPHGRHPAPPRAHRVGLAVDVHCVRVHDAAAPLDQLDTWGGAGGGGRGGSEARGGQQSGRTAAAHRSVARAAAVLRTSCPRAL